MTSQHDTPRRWQFAKFRSYLAAFGGQESVPWIAAIDSMTDLERTEPRVVSRSRIQRIACGSGTSAQSVRDLVFAVQLADLDPLADPVSRRAPQL